MKSWILAASLLLAVCPAPASATPTAATETPMIAEIESAVATFIREKFEMLEHEVEVKAHKRVQSLSRPKVSVAVLSGSLRKVRQGAYDHELNLSVYLEFTDFESEKDRHEAALPLVEGLFARMIGQRFEMDIDPIEPVRWDNVTDEDEDARGQICFLLSFKTSSCMQAIDDTEYHDLMKVVMDTYLKPGDETADASTEITLPEPA